MLQKIINERKSQPRWQISLLSFYKKLPWQPTPVFLPGKVHGQRSLAGCSPGGYMTKHVCMRVVGHGLVAINWYNEKKKKKEIAVATSAFRNHYPDQLAASASKQDLPPANRLWLAEGSDDRHHFWAIKYFLLKIGTFSILLETMSLHT